jgi:hypothetical protein
MYIPNQQSIDQIIINKQYPYFMSTINSQDQICIYNFIIFMWISLVYILYKYYDSYSSYNNYIIKYKYN